MKADIGKPRANNSGLSCLMVRADVIPPRGRGDFVLCFNDGQTEVKKHLRIDTLEVLTSKESDKKAALGYGIFSKVREALRDIAYAQHGEGWRNHAPFGPATEDETRLMCGILDRLHELKAKP